MHEGVSDTHDTICLWPNLKTMALIGDLQDSELSTLCDVLSIRIRIGCPIQKLLLSDSAIELLGKREEGLRRLVEVYGGLTYEKLDWSNN